MNGFSLEDHTGYTVVRFESILPEMSWDEVEHEAADIAQKIADAKTGNLIIDLSPMDLIQSGLVASMVRMWKATEGHAKRRVVVAAPNEIVKEVLRSAGLFKVFNVVDSLKDASTEIGAVKLEQKYTGDKRFSVWGLGVLMLLLGIVLGALGAVYLSSPTGERSVTLPQLSVDRSSDSEQPSPPPETDDQTDGTEDDSSDVEKTTDDDSESPPNFGNI